MSQILVSKYKTGVDFPPLRTGLTHVAGENTLTFPYKAGDTQQSFSNTAGTHLCLVNGGGLILTDDTDTFEVAFNASDITVTWLDQRNSLQDIDDVVWVFNAFSKPTSGLTKFLYGVSGANGNLPAVTVTGTDLNGAALSFQDDAVLVFVNDQFLDASDYVLSNQDTITIQRVGNQTVGTISGAVSVIAFNSVINQSTLSVIQTNAAASATESDNHATTAQRWATEADTTTVVDADNSTNYNEYSAKSYAQGTGTPGGSAKEWASKTGSPVSGSEYSAKYWATDTNVTTVSGNITTITNVNNNLSSIQTINNNMTDVVSLASSLGGVTTYTVTVAQSGGVNVYYIDGVANPTLTMERGNSYVFDLSDNTNSGHPLAFKDGSTSYTTGVTTTGNAGTAGAQVRIDVSSNAPATLRYYCTVHGNAMGNTISVINSNFSIVAANIGNVNTTANNISDVNTLASSTNLTNIGTVAGQISPTNNLSTVAGVATHLPTVAGVAADITTVAGQITNNNLQTIAADIADVQTVANDLNETTSEIDTVANAITNVDNVGNNITAVNTVAGQIAPTNNISTVAGQATNVGLVGSNISHVTTVAGIQSDVTTVAGIASDVTTAATNVTQFNDTYHGALSSPPTGSNVTTGDLYFDNTAGQLKVYDGSNFINAGSAINGTAQRVQFTATAGQTTFSVSYDAGFVDVYLNGIKLIVGTDFTATNGTSIVLASGAAVNDTVDIVAYGTFTLSNIALNDLTDVSTGTPVNGQVLTFNSTSGDFEPQTPAAAGATTGFALAMSIALG